MIILHPQTLQAILITRKPGNHISDDVSLPKEHSEDVHSGYEVLNLEDWSREWRDKAGNSSLWLDKPPTADILRPLPLPDHVSFLPFEQSCRVQLFHSGEAMWASSMLLVQDMFKGYIYHYVRVWEFQSVLYLFYRLDLNTIIWNQVWGRQTQAEIYCVKQISYANSGGWVPSSPDSSPSVHKRFPVDTHWSVTFLFVIYKSYAAAPL